MTDSVYSLHRLADDAFECHGVLSRMRWRISSKVAHELLNSPEDCSQILPSLSNLTAAEPNRTVLDMGHMLDAGMGAWYLGATYDYPFLNYAEDGYRQDRQRMQRYATSLTGAVAGWPVAHESRMLEALDVDPRLTELMRIVFGSIAQGQARWYGTPLYRRTSPSGGGRNPTNGYLLVPGMSHALYMDPISNRLIESPLTVPVDLRSCQVLLTLSPGRNRSRYREPRTFRTIFMDLGHVARSLRQAAISLGLTVWPGASLSDSLPGAGAWGHVFDLNLDEFPVLFVGVGEATPSLSQIQDDRESVRATAVSRPSEQSISAGGLARLTGVVVDTARGRYLASSTHGSVDVSRRLDRIVDEMMPLSAIGDMSTWLSQGWALAKDMLLGSTPYQFVPQILSGGPDSSLASMFTRSTERKFSPAYLPVRTVIDIVGVAPSLRPRLRVGLIAFRVEGLDPGVYELEGDSFSQIRRTNVDELREIAVSGLQGQSSPMTASAMVCLIADHHEYSRGLPGPPALYRAWIEAGALLQSCILRAEELGIRGLPTPAVTDSVFDRLFDLATGSATVIHTFSFGPIFRRRDAGQDTPGMVLERDYDSA